MNAQSGQFVMDFGPRGWRPGTWWIVGALIVLPMGWLAACRLGEAGQRALSGGVSARGPAAASRAGSAENRHQELDLALLVVRERELRSQIASLGAPSDALLPSLARIAAEAREPATRAAA